MNTTPVLRALAQTLSEMIRIGNLDDADTKLALLIVCGDGTNDELSISPDDYAALMKLAGESSHRSLAHYLTDVLTDALDRNLGRAGD